MKIEGETGFVLHTRPYRETSQLVDLFTRHHGRFRVVVKGVRGKQSGAAKSRRQLQPLHLLQLAWSGRGELKNLISAESLQSLPLLQGHRLYSAFYLNELLLRLLIEHDPHERLFDCYLDTVIQLPDTPMLEQLLRKFELNLLIEIGYGLQLDCDVETGESIKNGSWYWFDQDRGFVERVPPVQQRAKSNWFSGKTLQSIAAESYDDDAVSRDAKRLLRLALQFHLGSKPLHSRDLFRAGAQQSVLPRAGDKT